MLRNKIPPNLDAAKVVLQDYLGLAQSPRACEMKVSRSVDSVPCSAQVALCVGLVLVTY